MVTFLITSFLILGFFIVVVYLWQKPRASVESHELAPAPEPRGLFSAEQSNPLIELAAEDQEQKLAGILRRANEGDTNALKDAHLEREPAFYGAVLDALVNHATTEPQLLSLVSCVTRSELPVNTALARAIFNSWQRSPDRSSTTKALHVVALANDASLYTEAVESAMACWREGKLPDITPEELQALLEGEFWLLSSNTRSSGAGFLLKRALASARRELETSAHVNQ
jgi:hypothetical protein